jgi:hypothetical protein
MKDTTKAFVARNKLRLFIGASFVGLFLSFLGYETFAKVWADTFAYYGIPPMLMYALGPILIVSGCWLVGYEYEKQKIWEYEVSHQNVNINPEFSKVCRDIEKIKAVLGIDD